MSNVHRNDDALRYELVEDGEVIGIADLRLDGDRVVFTHTEVDEDHRGEGRADELIRDALDDVRRRGEQIGIECRFVRHFVDEHPEYQDLEVAVADHS